MQSLYAQYIKEREGTNTIEDEYGFATYKFVGEYCYIVNVYVKPEFRGSHIATSYETEVANIAREKGYKKLLGSVAPEAVGATASLKAMLASNYKLLKANEGLIFFVKEIV